MTKEIWKVWKETFESRYGHRIYEVSNMGRVKINGEIYECCIGKNNGYKYIAHKLLHRIVAELFIPNPFNYKYIDHINGNKLDNRVENLRWCTQKENCNNPISVTKRKNQKTCKSIVQYTLDNKFVAEYKSIREAERQTNIKRVQISNCCRNLYRYKTAGGFIWKFKK